MDCVKTGTLIGPGVSFSKERTVSDLSSLRRTLSYAGPDLDPAVGTKSHTCPWDPDTPVGGDGTRLVGDPESPKTKRRRTSRALSVPPDTLIGTLIQTSSPDLSKKTGST